MVHVLAFKCKLISGYSSLKEALEKHLDDDSELVTGYFLNDKDGEEIFIMKSPPS